MDKEERKGKTEESVKGICPKTQPCRGKAIIREKRGISKGSQIPSRPLGAYLQGKERKKRYDDNRRKMESPTSPKSETQ